MVAVEEGVGWGSSESPLSYIMAGAWTEETCGSGTILCDSATYCICSAVLQLGTKRGQATGTDDGFRQAVEKAQRPTWCFRSSSKMVLPLG